MSGVGGVGGPEAALVPGGTPPWWPGWRPAAELVRLPAVLSVPGDVLVGAAAAGWPFGRRTAALVASSGCLYWAGMALNDWADRAEDAVDRPGRPIPSGRARPEFALALAGALTVAGTALAGCGGRSAMRAAVPLVATVWTYDLWAKFTPAGPVAMAAARGLDVLLGAGGRRAAWPAAGTIAAHTAAVTVLSRLRQPAATTPGGPPGPRWPAPPP
jgi:4-hydroxybenzoate polyprenyltransferase